MTEYLQTPLRQAHEVLGARFMPFSGWEMPLWYPNGAVSEHRAVISHAGLFDTSHMSMIALNGIGSFGLLQECFTRDLVSLKSGRCAYGAFLNPDGGVIDDALAYRYNDEQWLVVVNAGMGGPMAAHLKENAPGTVNVLDLSGRLGKMDIQGPLSARILSRVLQNPEQVFQSMPYFSFKGFLEETGCADPAEFIPVRLINDTPVLISRTGYTGEFGFELFLPEDRMVEAWEMTLRAGEPLGLLPCGLAARDSLRAGAVLPLSHQDIGPWPFINHPWPFALPFNSERAAFTKRFIGDVVLEKRNQADHTLAILGFDPRKVAVHDDRGRPAVALDEQGREIGVVLTCVADMAMDRVGGRGVSLASAGLPDGFRPKGLACGFVRVREKPEPGRLILLHDRRREIKVEIVEDIRPDRTAHRPLKEFF